MSQISVSIGGADARLFEAENTTVEVFIEKVLEQSSLPFDWYYLYKKANDKLMYISKYDNILKYKESQLELFLYSNLTYTQRSAADDTDTERDPQNPKTTDKIFNLSCLIYYSENKNDNGYLDFYDENCDGDCLGWDGASRRCQCGNRRVQYALVGGEIVIEPY